MLLSLPIVFDTRITFLGDEDDAPNCPALSGLPALAPANAVDAGGALAGSGRRAINPDGRCDLPASWTKLPAPSTAPAPAAQGNAASA